MKSGKVALEEITTLHKEVKKLHVERLRVIKEGEKKRDKLLKLIKAFPKREFPLYEEQLNKIILQS